MKSSLCILTCGQVEGTKRLIASVRSFVDCEVVIGDNSPSFEDREVFRKLADTWFYISDRELWFDGFGVCKQQIVTAAANDWCMIADPDEVWYPVSVRFSGGVLRTDMLGVSHGRVFDRRQYRLMGMIHEELYRRSDRRNWSFEALPCEPFARIEHFPAAQPLWYKARKRILYDNLLHRIAQKPDISPGTASYWWREYWPTRAGSFSPTSYETWVSQYGGESG